MAVKIDKGRSAGVLDLTPMIDVVFLLLIFFMVATKFAEQDVELDVQLASASEARPLTATEQDVYINITGEGRYFVDGRFMVRDELDAFLRQKQVDSPGSVAVKIRPDATATAQPIISALNLCTKNSIQNVSFAASGEEE